MTEHHFEESPQVTTCPRHPDRVTYTRCGRCGRPTCTECQVPLEVGLMCVDCRDEHRRQNKVRSGPTTAPLVTFVLIGLNILAYLLQQFIPGRWMLIHFLFNPLYVEMTGEWWRVLTSGFLHAQSSPTHLLLNMFSLWLFGRAIEPMMGRWKYLLVYVLSIVGGSLGVWIWGALTGDLNVNTVGASGAIFGLFGAFFVLTRMRGANATPILTLIAINMVFGFIMPGISWQAHLGGLFTGIIVTMLLQRLRAPRR
ncbi:rhomboid family intramembrane serine protease [Rothia amarae]|uniref:rhomboid family intramembrane serine protease n=2 Tax=Rothia TaxID=32207 RepID=UPI0011A3A46F